MNKFYFKSPIGILEIVEENNALISLKPANHFVKNQNKTDFIQNVISQLNEYFIGKRKKFDIKLVLNGTDFQKLVWCELIKIPYGTTKSYSEIAKDIGHNKAARAVGSACNKNPIIIIVPCHRILSKNGDLKGFAHGIDLKEKLLNMEKAN